MNVRNKSRPVFAVLVLLVTGLLDLSPPLVGTAHAIVGRPLTPMSYAGVARRTTRRAAYVGATAPVVYPAPPPYAPYPAPRPYAAAYW
jgi:hypothetical protein